MHKTCLEVSRKTPECIHVRLVPLTRSFESFQRWELILAACLASFRETGGQGTTYGTTRSSQRTPGVSFSPLGWEAGVSSTVFPSPEVLIASAPFHKPASQAGSSRKRWILIQFSEMWQREMDARLPYPAFVSPEHWFPP